MVVVRFPIFICHVQIHCSVLHEVWHLRHLVNGRFKQSILTFIAVTVTCYIAEKAE
jgi:hypothetical protein